MTKDEFPKPGVTTHSLSTLKPVFVKVKLIIISCFITKSRPFRIKKDLLPTNMFLCYNFCYKVTNA